MAATFYGYHQHTLDEKGRLTLPAEFRTALEKGAFMGRFPGGCLAIYTPERFDQVSDDITAIAKEGSRQADLNASRVFFASVQSFTPDKQGRVAIPAHLRTSAHLERDVVVTGQQKRIELWNPERWEAVEAEGVAELTSRPGWGM